MIIRKMIGGNKIFTEKKKKIDSGEEDISRNKREKYITYTYYSMLLNITKINYTFHFYFKIIFRAY